MPGSGILTTEMKRLLYLISRFTKTAQTSGEMDYWIKDISLIALIYEGIVNNIFPGYDYGPTSVLFLDGKRRFMNVSREGLDDLNDLRELGLLDLLRISTMRFGNVTAYKLSSKGWKTLGLLTDTDKTEVDKIICCPICKALLSIECVNFEKFEFRCSKHGMQIQSGVFDIEDVSYESRPYFIRLPYKMEEKLHDH
ncbi:MAG: hypothetical protein ACTSYO_09400 [Candidatus Ranarchaeia archaeon]